MSHKVLMVFTVTTIKPHNKVGGLVLLLPFTNKQETETGNILKHYFIFHLIFPLFLLTLFKKNPVFTGLPCIHRINILKLDKNTEYGP